MLVAWWLFIAAITLQAATTGPTLAQVPVTGTAGEGVMLGLTGDVMLGRMVNEVIDRHGYAYPWGDLLPLLQEPGLLLVNLETTLTHSEQRIPKRFNFRASPDKVRSLVLAGVDVCNLANNHILDYSVSGLRETLAVLDRHGIAHTGAGLDAAAARSPVITQINGLRIAILGVTDNEPDWQARADTAGTHYLSISQPEPLLLQIRNLDKQVDLLVLSIHWGANYRRQPSDSFVHLAHRLVDAGVDILHGHSAHIFQGIEFYRGGVILYDTGNFVDDYLVYPDYRNDQSIYYRFLVSSAGIEELELVPVRIRRGEVNRATGKDYEQILQRQRALSRPFGTRIVEQHDRVLALHE